MVTCPKCKNERNFIQYSKALHIKRKITSDAGGIQPNAIEKTKPPEEDRDGLYCGKCSHRFTSDLSELGIPKFGKTITERYDVADIVARVNSEMGPDAEIKYRIEGGAEAIFGEVNIHPKLKELLEGNASIKKFWRHQALAIQRVTEGKNVVVQTKTASGKSLCFQIPVLQAMLRPIKPSCLLLFPTKALAYDQIQRFAVFSEKPIPDVDAPVVELVIAGNKIKIVNLNGDTKTKVPESDRYSADILITNPDFIYANMLNNFHTKHGTWKDFFRRLKFIVVDEIHQYRGVFGANTALLFRRIGLICKTLGSNPQYIAGSATLSNPKEHAERLTGKEFELIDNDGAPHRKRHFFILNPKEKERSSETKEASTVALNLIFEKGILFNEKYQVQTIAFGRSRLSVSTLLARSKRVLSRISSTLGFEAEDVKNILASFMGTYSEEERRLILNRLKTKEIGVVFATNALELGIDISSITCSVIFDYPGTSASLLQQMGRSGRDRESLSFLILKNEPLQQYFFRNEDYFFEMMKTPEPAVINFNNEELLKIGMRGVRLDEYNLRLSNPAGVDENELKTLVGEKAVEVLRQIPRLTTDSEFQRLKKEYCGIGIRTASAKFAVECDGKVIGGVDEFSVGRDRHPGAIWEDNRGTYKSERIDYHNKVVIVKKIEDGDTYTICDPSDHITVLDEIENGPINQGRIEIKREYEQYYILSYSSQRKPEWHAIYEDTVKPLEHQTPAAWLDFELEGDEITQAGGIIGLRNLLSTWVPHIARCDRNDIACNYERYDADKLYRLFIYDNVLIETGYSEVFKLRYREILKCCLDFVTSCDCVNGCPKCLYLPNREFDNAEINKSKTISILETLLSDERQPKQFM